MPFDATHVYMREVVRALGFAITLILFQDYLARYTITSKYLIKDTVAILTFWLDQNSILVQINPFMFKNCVVLSNFMFMQTELKYLMHMNYR